MSFFEILDTFNLYGFDITALAAVTCIIVQVLKLTALKKCKKKVITFLPFVIGVILYAVYVSICKMSAVYVFENIAEVLECGFAIGSLSTVLYVGYEQLIREKTYSSGMEGVISTLIEGYVPSDAVESVAKQIANAIEKDVEGNGAKKAAEILVQSADGNVSEKDIALLAKLIIDTLATLNAH